MRGSRFVKPGLVCASLVTGAQRFRPVRQNLPQKAFLKDWSIDYGGAGIRWCRRGVSNHRNDLEARGCDTTRCCDRPASGKHRDQRNKGKQFFHVITC